MRKIIIFLLSQFLLLITVNSQNLERLAKAGSEDILEFFSNKYDVTTAIVKFENYSYLSDLSAQKFYQLLISKLETSNKIKLLDLMVNFDKGQGKINLTKSLELNYLIYVKLIKNRNKIGAGIVIFSKTLNKIVSIKYREKLIPGKEMEIYETVDYGFEKFGFTNIVEFNGKKDLLDIETVYDPDEVNCRYFFYFPEEIRIYVRKNDKLVKQFSFKLNWGRPYYPVIKPEGKITCFYNKRDLYLIVGGNFSSNSKIFVLRDSEWKEIGQIDIVPFKYISLNRRFYLAGGRYESGKNYFNGKIFLIPFIHGKFERNDALEKDTLPFYDLDFAVQDKELRSIHLIDKNYLIKFYSSDFTEIIVENENKKGGSISSLNNEWIALSDHSRNNDKLFYYNIKDGGRRLVYENKIEGEVQFIARGQWKTFKGFWVYIRKNESRQNRFKLNFVTRTND